MNLTVPQVAASVYDQGFGGTGNWPFNTAFAGGFSGMRSCVTRLDDLSEVENWIAAGLPVILSTRWDCCNRDARRILTGIWSFASGSRKMATS